MHTRRFTRTRVAAYILGLLFVIAPASATVGPPVRIRMPRDTAVPAVSGQEYAGTIEVQVGREGTLDTFRLEGEGWQVMANDAPAQKVLKPGEVLTIAFRAVPDDSSSPLKFSVRFDGRKAKKSFRLSAAEFERWSKPRPLTRIGPGVRPGAVPGGGDAPEGGGSNIHFTGRIVYTRPAMNGQLEQVVGADGVKVEIKDEDDVTADETIWEGVTDQDGFIDVNVIWDDCDILGCDAPDLYLRYETGTGVVDVEDPGLFETNYSWSTAESMGVVEDFSGDAFDFGTLTPSDPADFPALHIHTSIVRAHRFVLTRVGIDIEHVDVQWPEDAGSWYDTFLENIHIGVDEQWVEGTHTHEYGHHFMENYSQNPTPDYCNGNCDDGDDCGHCTWCPEEVMTAWFEGWPDWLASVVLRAYEADYGVIPLSINDGRYTLEVVEMCPYAHHDAGGAEGFVGAILRDIEDPIEDADGDGNADPQEDCGRDALALGVTQIFQVVTLDQPTYLLAFAQAFHDRFPEHRPGLWKTLHNFGWNTYLIWPDVEPPGAVTILDSPTHPLGIGGNSPLITVTWQEPPDDESGADVYTFQWLTAPEFPTYYPHCFLGPYPEPHQFTMVSPPLFLGQHWLAIQARDCDGNYGPGALFGPFEITECNGNGIIDVCETTCDLCEALPPGQTCTSQIDNFCLYYYGCGTVPDCNGNHTPDACDLANGVSNDCNANAIPDECEAIVFKEWTIGGGDWYGVDEQGQPSVWDGGFPGPADHVCIHWPDVTVFAIHSEGTTQIASLGCYDNFVLSGGSISGTEDFVFYGPFYWTAGELAAPSGPAPIIKADGLLHLIGVAGGPDRILSNRVLRNNLQADWVGDGRIVMNGGAVIENPAEFTATGDGLIFSSGGTPQFNNSGVFSKNFGAGPDGTRIFVPFTNSGTVYIGSGLLDFSAGGITSIGDVVGALSTTLKISGGDNHFLVNSSVNVDSALFAGGTVEIDGSYQVGPGTTVGDATVHFNPAANLIYVGDTLSITGSGSIEFNTGEPVTLTNYNHTNGTLSGSDDVTVNGTWTWKLGTVSAPANLPAGATADIHANGGLLMAANCCGGSRTLTNRILHNPGAATWTWAPATPPPDPASACANIVMDGSAVIENTGIFNARGNAFMFAGYGTPQFLNAGTFTKLNSTGTTTIQVAFVNEHTVSIESGTLKFDSPGISSADLLVSADGATLEFGGGTNTFADTSSTDVANLRVTGGVTQVDGTFHVSAATTVNVGTLNLNPGADVLGIGDVLTISEGTLNLNSGQSFTVTSYTHTGGTLDGSSDLTVTDQFNWTFGTLRGPSGQPPGSVAQVHAAGGLLMSGACCGPDRFLIDRVLTNSAAAEWAGGARIVMGGAAMIDNSGTFNIIGDSMMFSAGGSPLLLNSGTLRKSAGTGATTIGVPLHNTGTFSLESGSVVFADPFSELLQTAGETVLNGGNLESFEPVALHGGVLRGNGTITGSLVDSGGIVAPGLSAGTMVVTGDYENGGTLAIELGGTAPGSQHDALIVGGTATLNGTLNISLINGYVPPVGSTYQILTASAVTGTFANVMAPPGLQVTVIYGPNSVTLLIGSVPVDIASANPPKANPYGAGVFRDVLQNTTTMLVPQGIGVAGTPNEGPVSYASITVTFSGPASPPPAPGNIGVTCTDTVGNGLSDCPTVASVSGAALTWMLTLTAPPPPRECITFTFAGTNAGQRLQYQVLPSDVDLSGVPNTSDLLTFVQALNDGSANQPTNLARYNLDRSAPPVGVNTQDLLRLVQLLNGTLTTQAFNGATVAVCP